VTSVDDLLSAVLEAHGGQSNWSKVTAVIARLSMSGPFWEARGWPGILDNQTVRLDPRREHITFTPFTGPGRSSVFDVAPERLAIRDTHGVIDERTDPRASYPKGFDVFTTRWDAIQVGYFASAAMWNYLTQPFSLAYDGVDAHEIDPWEEDGQVWRRLAVTFPETNANHNADQVFYFDEHLMQRRMDYAPFVANSGPTAHYQYDQQAFDGFVYPTRRRIHPRGPDGIADKSFTVITVDVQSVAIEW
jgi:hypothetical protein